MIRSLKVLVAVLGLQGRRSGASPLWEAVAEVRPDHPGERDFPGGSRDALASILEDALDEQPRVRLVIDDENPIQ